MLKVSQRSVMMAQPGEVINSHFDSSIFHVCYITDPRVESWLLMSTPLPTTALFFLYLFIVWLGPRFMKSRRPVSLRLVIIPYNLALVVLSAYMFYEVSYVWYWATSTSS